MPRRDVIDRAIQGYLAPLYREDLEGGHKGTLTKKRHSSLVLASLERSDPKVDAPSDEPASVQRWGTSLVRKRPPPRTALGPQA